MADDPFQMFPFDPTGAGDLATASQSPVVREAMDNALARQVFNPNMLSSSAGNTQLASMDPAQARQMVLDKIASGESPDYNTIYGGQKFNSYAQHPGVRVPIPGTNEYSDAAGRYQFISPTWNDQASKLGLTDFSPASQDKAAWNLASTTYKSSTGRDLMADAQSGKVDYGALKSQWPSLAGGGASSATSSTGGGDMKSAISQALMGGQGEAGSGLYKLALLQSLMPHLKFTPVDYDPFKIQQQEVEGEK